MSGFFHKTLVCDKFSYGVVFSEAEYLKMTKRMSVPNPGRWMNIGANATTHTFANSDGSQLAVVAISVADKVTLPQLIGLIVHESMHIWQAFLEYIGETGPSKEFEAYSVQTIVQNIIQVIADQHPEVLFKEPK